MVTGDPRYAGDAGDRVRGQSVAAVVTRVVERAREKMTREELAQFICEQISGRGPVSGAEVLTEYENVVSVKTDDGEDFFVSVQASR